MDSSVLRAKPRDNRIMVTEKTAVLMGAIAWEEVANSCLHAEPYR
jgi:hypothetical protein